MSIPARAILAPPSTGTLEVVVEEERVKTEYGRALPRADYESTSDIIASALKDEAPDLQQARDGATGDPEAPPWNFLFLSPVAMFVMFAIFGLVMCFDR
jgi:hypothetical protein